MTTTSHTSENIRTQYLQICQEITRYRDLEWKNSILFVGSLAALIGFRLSYDSHFCEKINIDLPLSIIFSALAVANVYYNSYAHFKLAENRLFQASLQEKLGIKKHDGGIPLTCIGECFMRGFISHLLPSFLATITLTYYGFKLLSISDSELNMIITLSISLLLIGIITIVYQASKK